MITTRRGLLTGGLALLFAPAIVRASSIMSVRPVPGPQGAWYAQEWGRAVAGLYSENPLVLTPWQAENLAKPCGFKEGVQYVLRREMPIHEVAPGFVMGGSTAFPMDLDVELVA